MAIVQQTITIFPLINLHLLRLTRVITVTKALALSRKIQINLITVIMILTILVAAPQTITTITIMTPSLIKVMLMQLLIAITLI